MLVCVHDHVPAATTKIRERYREVELSGARVHDSIRHTCHVPEGPQEERRRVALCEGAPGEPGAYVFWQENRKVAHTARYIVEENEGQYQAQLRPPPRRTRRTRSLCFLAQERGNTCARQQRVQ
jgi:hypothetical protein